MIRENFLNGVAELLGAFAAISIIVTAFGLMLGIMKPADAFKWIGVIVGAVIMLLVLPGIVVSAWSAMMLWQQMAMAALGIAIGIAGFECLKRGKGNNR